MPLRFRLANPRFIFPTTTTVERTVVIPKRHAMSSTTPNVGVGVPEDAQHWHRQISPNVPPHWVYTKPIQKSQQDDREYRLIRLDNGLQAMLVHDATADKAAASLDVAVGHLHDPASIHLPTCCHTYAKYASLTCVTLIGRYARARTFLRASFVHGAYVLTSNGTSLTTRPYRGLNNSRRRTNTPKYADAVSSGPSNDFAVSL
jgi:hypothetical protein